MKTRALLFLLVACGLSQAQNLAGFNGHCSIGGQDVVTGGLVSSATQAIGGTNPVSGSGVLASFPECQVAVFLTGTSNPATLYSNNTVTPTPLGNPFTANNDGSFLFYATPDVGYDIVISSSSFIALPNSFTLTNVILFSNTVLTITNAGVFTSSQMNVPVQVLLNGATPALYSNEFNPSCPGCQATSPIFAGVIVPPSSTVNAAYSVLGAVQNNSTTTEAAGMFAMGLANANGTFVEGANFLAGATNNSLTSLKIYGIEVDVGCPSSGTCTNLAGIILTGGGGNSGVPVGASALAISPIGWEWPVGLNCQHGATTDCVLADGLNAGNNTASSPISWQSWDNSGLPHLVTSSEDVNGNLNFAFFNNGVVTNRFDISTYGGLRIESGSTVSVGKLVSQLASCGSSLTGAYDEVCDASSPVIGNNVSGTGTCGSTSTGVHCNGVNWTVFSK